MSAPRDEPPTDPGRRKDGKRFKDGNTREDGSYLVGRNRTPDETKFRKDDDRPRGRRSKGVINADTAFEKELNRKITVQEGGTPRTVPKGFAVDLRLIDKALKGDTKAIDMVDDRRRRITSQKEANGFYHSQSDHEILDAYVLKLVAESRTQSALLGDPEPVGDTGDNPDD